MRSAFFFDFGNVFSDNCKEYQFNCYEPSIDDLRYSYGVGVTWITGFGPMSFAIAKPTNAGQYEELRISIHCRQCILINIKYHSPIRGNYEKFI